MNYPLIIENEPELCRLLRRIFQEVTKDPAADLPVLMSIRACCRINGVSYYMVKAALAKGELKLTNIGGKAGIKRNDFINWINKTK